MREDLRALGPEAADVPLDVPQPSVVVIRFGDA